jgi:hypothetical protein
MRFRTSRHSRYSDTCGGELTVFVTPTDETDRHGKSAMYVGITRPDGFVWDPGAALWISPLYDPDSREGRREAADAAVDFFESFGCGQDVQHNPLVGRVGTVFRNNGNALDLILTMAAELRELDVDAADKLIDAYRVARPRGRAEVSAFIEALPKRSMRGLQKGCILPRIQLTRRTLAGGRSTTDSTPYTAPTPTYPRF